MAEDERRRDTRSDDHRIDRAQQIRERAQAAYGMAVREAAIMQLIDARRAMTSHRPPTAPDNSRRDLL